MRGFQAAVDDAIDQADADRVFDARRSARLDLSYTPIEEGTKVRSEAGAADPHFWLDPTRLAAVSEAFATFLEKVDPAHGADYRANLESLIRRLDDLDHDMRVGLSDCANRDLVTSHNAFGYLARRYGLEQVGIAGLTPEAEPSPSDLASVSRFVDRHHVRTIYFETLVSRDLARTVADESGAKTEVLDPIEGLNQDSQGSNYLQIMRSNLTNLRSGQPCP
jgi:zinc transport system substrate-binding protein